MSDKNTENFDDKKYAELLAEFLPKPIKTEEENEHYLELVNDLMNKSTEGLTEEEMHYQGKSNLTEEESAMLELLAILIQEYEERIYPTSSEMDEEEK